MVKINLFSRSKEVQKSSVKMQKSSIERFLEDKDVIYEDKICFDKGVVDEIVEDYKFRGEETIIDWYNKITREVEDGFYDFAFEDCSALYLASEKVGYIYKSDISYLLSKTLFILFEKYVNDSIEFGFEGTMMSKLNNYFYSSIYYSYKAYRQAVELGRSTEDDDISYRSKLIMSQALLSLFDYIYEPFDDLISNGGLKIGSEDKTFSDMKEVLKEVYSLAKNLYKEYYALLDTNKDKIPEAEGLRKKLEEAAKILNN